MNKLSLLGDTKSKIVSLLLERQQSAVEISHTLKIQVSAARKHLEAMAELGIVDSNYISDGVGRPKKVFKLNGNGSELLPNQYSNVLNGLISKLMENGNSKNVEHLLEQVADEIGQSMRVEILSVREPKGLVQVLSRHGFHTTIERSADKTLSITCRNCPMHDVTAKHKELICDHVHDQILRSAFDTPRVERKKSAASGDEFCLHVVKT